MAQQDDCPFCQIARGEMDTEFVHEEENLVAFEDLEKQAPVHVLVIPRDHITAVTDVSPEMLKQLVDATQKVAETQGVTERGYAIRINNGEEAGQQVEHLHIHVMGGRQLSMP
ncbi:MAG: HIT domain-containing protein [Actinobacteria bacterium]|nr:HIT domain-containing protein [Actinomycetota bacterium]MCA1737288.1 HIT domain-containing protein [Actinomycetota bacterium]